jgi:hypothetical protein
MVADKDLRARTLLAGAKAIIQDRRIMYGLKPVPFNDG